MNYTMMAIVASLGSELWKPLCNIDLGDCFLMGDVWVAMRDARVVVRSDGKCGLLVVETTRDEKKQLVAALEAQKKLQLESAWKKRPTAAKDTP